MGYWVVLPSAHLIDSLMRMTVGVMRRGHTEVVMLTGDSVQTCQYAAELTGWWAVGGALRRLGPQAVLVRQLQPSIVSSEGKLRCCQQAKKKKEVA